MKDCKDFLIYCKYFLTINLEAFYKFSELVVFTGFVQMTKKYVVLVQKETRNILILLLLLPNIFQRFLNLLHIVIFKCTYLLSFDVNCHIYSF